MLAGELPEQRQQHVVDDDEAVLRVGGDPAQLVGRKAQVQRVHHAARGRNAEVALEVRVMVPAQRGDALARLEAEPLQRRGERARAPAVLGVAVPAQALVGHARDDLVAAEQLAGAVEQVVQRQRHVHHRRAHGSLLESMALHATASSPASTRARYSASSTDITTSEA